MEMHPIDIGIILAYVVGVIIIGVLLSRRAGADLGAYFLGGNKVPWYVLGTSNASTMFDITGTMWLVYVIFVYGLKGAYLPWLWPTFNQVFLMVYLSVWIRRSGVLTGGEWMGTRFGKESGGELARIAVVIFAIVSVIGFLSYTFKGIGKFAAVFFPWDLTPDTYAIIVMSITTIYVILGGMYSVVITDIFQFIMMTVVSVAIGYIAMTRTTTAEVAEKIPSGWMDLSFGWELQLDWSNLIPSVNDKIAADGYSFFTIVMMMMLFKGFLVSLAGPTPSFDLQRVLATRRPKESALMSAIVPVCLFPRWLMITGFTVLALVFFSDDLNSMGADIDFEMILPYVLNNFIPVGVTGLVIAGLLASFMSTFDSTVNAGASYLVVDIYKRYIKPDAPQKTYVFMSYVCSVLIVIVGFIFGLAADSIDSMMQWLVSGLWGGYTAPNLLKWHWWRFNGYGYFWGMIVGILASLLVPIALPEVSPLNGFPIILAISTLASIGASLLTKPESDDILKSFYSQVRPWGMWEPVCGKVLQENPEFKRNTGFKQDMVNIIVGIIWQLMLVLIPIYIVLKEGGSMMMGILVLAVTSFILKKNWYEKLEDY